MGPKKSDQDKFCGPIQEKVWSYIKWGSLEAIEGVSSLETHLYCCVLCLNLNKLIIIKNTEYDEEEEEDINLVIKMAAFTNS